MRTQTYLTYFKREFGEKHENCDVLAGSNAVPLGYAYEFKEHKVESGKI